MPSGQSLIDGTSLGLDKTISPMQALPLNENQAARLDSSEETLSKKAHFTSV